MEQIKERAIVGHTIVIKGNLSGDEDLTVQGRVEGKIELNNHNVTIGEKGTVKADIDAKIISIEGQVKGNLIGREKVVLRKSSTVHGNVTAPRVTLEDGCKFTGSIDMESTGKGLASSTQSSGSTLELTSKPGSKPEPKIVGGGGS